VILSSGMPSYYSSEAVAKEDKANSKADETVVLVGLASRPPNMNTSNLIFTSKRNIIIQMSFTRQFMRFKLAK
jgi:hypothetical protein